MGLFDIAKGSLGGPLGMGYNMFNIAYPFTQDKNFPGVAEGRHARALALQKTLRDNPQATGTALDGAPTTGDLLSKGYDWLRDPYGVNKPQAPAPAPYPAGSDPMTAGGTPTPPTPAPSYPAGSDPMAAGGAVSNGPGLPHASANGPSPLDNAAWPFGPVGAPSHGTVPTPQPRPAEAPQPEAPSPMGWFARNTAMQRDPLSGDFLDPAAAQRADVSGPDLIQKYMNYLHNKA